MWRSFSLFLLLWAGSIAAQSSIGQNLPEGVRLEQTFQMEQIPPVQLQMYQERGKQKVWDFFELVKFIQHKETEEDLRQFLIEQGVELFLNDSLPCLGFESVSAFLNSYEGSFPGSNGLHFAIQKGFEPESSGFVATMRASFPEFPHLASFAIVLDIHLVQRSKSFGKEELLLWEVFLGEMKWD